MSENNYKVFSIYDLNNILCIDDELCKSLDIECSNSGEYIDNLYDSEYINASNRCVTLPWNDNVNYWLNISDTQILKNEIINYFVNINDRSKLKNKTKIKDVDFVIE